MLTHLLRLYLGKTVKPFEFKPEPLDTLSFCSSRIGLYVHIPFCRQICDFCPYNKTLYKPELMKPYLAALEKEIVVSRSRIINRKGSSSFRQAQNGEGSVSGTQNSPAPKLVEGRSLSNVEGDPSNEVNVDSIYFGGGTPALAGKALIDIMALLHKHFTIDGPAAIELHPEDVNEEMLSILEEAGFGMVSLGVQSFDKKNLEALGRTGTDIAGKLRLLNTDFIKVRDVDLIFGIPGQTAQSLEHDFRTAVELGATQISTYPFIEFSYAGRKYPKADIKERKKMLAVLDKLAGDMGWERTSIWTFAAPGTRKYSSVTRDDFLGFGPGAASLLERAFKLNPFALNDYIQHWTENENPVSMVMPFNLRTRALYWLFWSSYGLDIDAGQFFTLFGEELDAVFGAELKMGIRLGLLEKEGRNYRLSSQGAYRFHRVEQLYTHQYIDKTWRACMKESLPDRIRLY